MFHHFGKVEYPLFINSSDIFSYASKLYTLHQSVGDPLGRSFKLALRLASLFDPGIMIDMKLGTHSISLLEQDPNRTQLLSDI